MFFTQTVFMSGTAGPHYHLMMDIGIMSETSISHKNSLCKKNILFYVNYLIRSHNQYIDIQQENQYRFRIRCSSTDIIIK